MIGYRDGQPWAQRKFKPNSILFTTDETPALHLATLLLPLVPLLWLVVDWRCQRPEWLLLEDVREAVTWLFL